MLCMLVAEGISYAQKAPPVPGHPWDASSAKQPRKTPAQLVPARLLDPAKIYTLSELVNIAELNPLCMSAGNSNLLSYDNSVRLLPARARSEFTGRSTEVCRESRPGRHCSNAGCNAKLQFDKWRNVFP